MVVGETLGPYRVLSKIGEGGMGEVYRARDARLDRIVALKILPAALASDPECLARFDREARAVASLNHPHICTLYDVGHQEGVHFLVMEYLGGETLAERLQGTRLTAQGTTRHKAQSRKVKAQLTRNPRRPTPSAQRQRTYGPASAGRDYRSMRRSLSPFRSPTRSTRRIARASCTAISSGNVMLVGGGDRKGGQSRPPVAKLLDFGLAKLVGPPKGGHYVRDDRSVRLQPDLNEAPTVSSPFDAAQGGGPLTGAGSILGTFQYMTPDGKRLLVLIPDAETGADPQTVEVVLNWVETLRRRVPTQ